MDGIVTGIRLAPNSYDNVYTLLSDGGGTVAKRSGVLLGLLEKVEIGDAGISIKEKKTSAAQYKKELGKRLRVWTKEKRSPHKTGIKELDATTKRMLPSLKKAAKELVKKCISGAPIIIRFHNDCDGASGAVAIYDALEALRKDLGIESLNVSWRMNKSIMYSAESFHYDRFFFNSFSSVEKPLVIITDFGTTPESEDAIKLCENKVDLIWLDHHPLYKGFPREKIMGYINSWDFGSDSDYTAGFLASMLAEVISKIDADILGRASLIGDFSRHGNRANKNAYMIAIALDYLTSKKDESTKLTPHHINSIIKDEQKLNEIFYRANTLLNESLEIGARKAKRYTAKDGLRVFVLEFSNIVRDNEDYPLPGRYSSWLQRRFEAQEHHAKVITMVHYGNYISVRAGKEIAESMNLINIVEGLKLSSEHIYSAGGHGPAFAIKTDKEHIGDVVSLFLSALGAVG
jgi:RecJ-like exonuclease